jgi:hypothetical protein
MWCGATLTTNSLFNDGVRLEGFGVKGLELAAYVTACGTRGVAVANEGEVGWKRAELAGREWRGRLKSS